MTLTENNIQQIKKAAGEVCAFGKLTLVIKDGLLFRITSENDRILYNDITAVKQQNNSGGNYAR